MPRVLLTLAISVALALPGAAWAFRAQNFHEVNPLPNGDFEVIGRPGSGAQQFWCGAADFALRRLGAASNTRVYLIQGRAPALTKPGWTAVTFSLRRPPEADALGASPLSLSVTAIGDSLRAAAAQQYCYDRFERDRFWRP